MTELACLAHARRKFYDLHAANQSPIAAEALQRIAELYVIEAEGNTLGAEERHALRQQLAKPKLESFLDWLVTTRRAIAPGSGTAKAIDYSLKRWDAIKRYLEDGRYPIDNNPVENTIRPIALGKKIGCLPVVNGLAAVLPRSRACSRRPNSTASSLMPG